MDERHNKPAYELLRKLINGDITIVDGIVAEYDEAPMTEEEKKLAEKAMREYEVGDCVNWEDIKDEV